MVDRCHICGKLVEVEWGEILGKPFKVCGSCRLRLLLGLEGREAGMREMRSGGSSLGEIGKRYGISKQRVWKILKGDSQDIDI